MKLFRRAVVWASAWPVRYRINTGVVASRVAWFQGSYSTHGCGQGVCVASTLHWWVQRLQRRRHAKSFPSEVASLVVSRNSLVVVSRSSFAVVSRSSYRGGPTCRCRRRRRARHKGHRRPHVVPPTPHAAAPVGEYVTSTDTNEHLPPPTYFLLTSCRASSGALAAAALSPRNCRKPSSKPRRT